MDVDRIIRQSQKVSEAVLRLLKDEDGRRPAIEIASSQDLEEFVAALALSCTFVYNTITGNSSNNMEVNHIFNNVVVDLGIRIAVEDALRGTPDPNG